jgi:uncharacterized SAM-binding protein YcdF (DUF218 family)
MSRSRRALLWIAGLCGLLLSVQLLVYACLLRSGLSGGLPAACDLFVVFGGGGARVERAFALSRQVASKAFVLSDTSKDGVLAYSRAFGPPGPGQILYEPMARSTDENAYNVAAIVKERHFTDILLVTSWYHIPRAAILLRLELFASGASVHLCSTEPMPRDWWREGILEVEVLKLWGSLLKVALRHVVSG